MRYLLAAYLIILGFLIIPGLSGIELKLTLSCMLWILAILRGLWLRSLLDRQKKKTDIANKRLHHCIDLLRQNEN